MDVPDCTNLFVGGVSSLCLVLMVLLFRRRRPGDRILAAILGAALANIYHARIGAHLAPDSAVLLEPLQFLLPPLFAAYIHRLTAPEAAYPGSPFLHFLPALLAAPASYFAVTWPAGGLPASLAFWGLLLVQAGIYLGWGLRRITRHRRRLAGEVSTLEGADLGWLKGFSWILHGLYGFFALVPVLLLLGEGKTSIRHMVGISLCLAAGTLALRELLAPDRLIPLPSLPPPPPGTKAAEWDPELPGALESVMKDRRLYRNPGLTLADLARETGWPRNQVSAALNGHFGLSFYDFVNSYRVDEVKLLMAKQENRGFTLLALGMEAGFNSKPTFYSVFKKMTGKTPSQWARSPAGHS